MKKVYFVPYLVNDENGIIPFVIKVEIYELEDLFRKTQELLMNQYDLDGFEFFDDENEVEDGNELYILVKVENAILI